jgi:hypothetical protein
VFRPLCSFPDLLPLVLVLMDQVEKSLLRFATTGNGLIVVVVD